MTNDEIGRLSALLTFNSIFIAILSVMLFLQLEELKTSTDLISFNFIWLTVFASLIALGWFFWSTFYTFFAILGFREPNAHIFWSSLLGFFSAIGAMTSFIFVQIMQLSTPAPFTETPPLEFFQTISIIFALAFLASPAGIAFFIILDGFFKRKKNEN